MPVFRFVIPKVEASQLSGAAPAQGESVRCVVGVRTAEGSLIAKGAPFPWMAPPADAVAVGPDGTITYPDGTGGA